MSASREERAAEARLVNIEQTVIAVERRVDAVIARLAAIEDRLLPKASKAAQIKKAPAPEVDIVQAALDHEAEASVTSANPA